MAARTAGGIKLLMEFTDNPTREGLIRWLHSMVAQRMYGSEAVAATSGNAIRMDNPTQRFWRDAHMGPAHAIRPDAFDDLTGPRLGFLLRRWTRRVEPHDTANPCTGLGPRAGRR